MLRGKFATATRMSVAFSVLFAFCTLGHAAEIPRPAPPIMFPTPEGGVIDVSQHRGKVVALEFLLTTCPHCQKSSRILQQMSQEYGSKGFQPLGVATNDMAHMLIGDFKKQFGVAFPIGFTNREKAHEYLQHPTMLIMYMPQMVFIDRKGIIRAQYPGGDKFYQDEERNVRAQIEALLKESGGPSPKAAPKPSTRKTNGKKAS